MNPACQLIAGWIVRTPVWLLWRTKLSAIALFLLAGAAFAESNATGGGSVVFDAIPNSPGYFILPDGGRYSIIRANVMRLGDEYFVDHYFWQKPETERIRRHRIVADQSGGASFDPNLAKCCKYDEEIPSINLLSDALTGYSAAVQRGAAWPEPRGLESYKIDGMLTKSSYGGCDPLKNFTSVSFAKIDPSMKRIDEISRDKSLIVLSDVPVINSRSLFTPERCPRLRREGYEHDLKAISPYLYFYKVGQAKLIRANGLPLSMVVRNIFDDFCTFLSYRDEKNEERKITLLYTSAEVVAQILQDVPGGAQENELELDQYSRVNSMSFDALSRTLYRFNCTTVQMN